MTTTTYPAGTRLGVRAKAPLPPVGAPLELDPHGTPTNGYSDGRQWLRACLFFESTTDHPDTCDCPTRHSGVRSLNDSETER